MPMNEYRRSDPRLLTSATALFESGVGRGSNLGSGTANRSATREKRKIKARNLFIAEDSTWHGALGIRTRSLLCIRGRFRRTWLREPWPLYLRGEPEQESERAETTVRMAFPARLRFRPTSGR